MARPVYTTQLFADHNFVGDASFEAPAGYLTVIRDVSWWVAADLTSSGDQFVYIEIGADKLTCDWFTVDADTTVMHHQELRVAVDAGQRIGIHADLAGDVVITGYLLTLP